MLKFGFPGVAQTSYYKFSVLDGVPKQVLDGGKKQVQEMLASLSEGENSQELLSLSEEYKNYKRAYWRDLMFDPSSESLSKTKR